MGGGSASVVTQEGGGLKSERGVPIPRDTHEEWSRAQVEQAVRGLADMYPANYFALNEVFNADVGGYRDLEFYSERQPQTARDAVFGVCLVGMALPPSRYPLTVRFPRERTPAENTREFVRDHKIYQDYKNGVKVRHIAKAYNCSERRVYQLVERQRSLEGEPKRGRGRPRT